MMSDEIPPALADVRRWLERAVIGLNLCPFARAVHVKGQIRWVLLDGIEDAEIVRERVQDALVDLADADPAVVDTTLIVLPHALPDFFEFSRFVDSLSAGLKRMGLRGVLQIASFHPQFEFAGEAPTSPSHFTNRSPYPVIHLLREASITGALERFGDADRIWQSNLKTLEGLSPADLEQVFPYGNWTAKP